MKLSKNLLLILVGTPAFLLMFADELRADTIREDTIYSFNKTYGASSFPIPIGMFLFGANPISGSSGFDPFDIPVLLIDPFSDSIVWGQTYIADGETSVNFDRFATQITDGIADEVGFWLLDTEGIGSSGHFFFFDDDPDIFALDLIGYEIDRVEIRFAEAHFPVVYDVQATVTIDFIGSKKTLVPDRSSTLMCFGIGIVAMWWRLRQFRRTV
jgi:hypothetical protein